MSFEPKLCDCPDGLLRRILGEERLQALGQRVIVCMRCGAKAAVRSRFEPIPYHPRDASEVVGFEALAITPAALDWLARWPRLIPLEPGQYWNADNSYYLPAQLRVADTTELVAAEAEARQRGRDLAYAERLRAANPPTEPPPAGTEVSFRFVIDAWRALQHAEQGETRPARATPLGEPAAWILAGQLT